MAIMFQMMENYNGDILMIPEIAIQIINMCQLKCNWCTRLWAESEDIAHREGEYMELDTFKKVVDKCIKYGIKEYNLTPMMGELLLDKHLFDRLDYLDKHKAKFFFTTNFVKTLCPNDMRRLLAYKTLDLGISIYGYDRASYFCNTNKDLFDKFVDNMGLLFKNCDRRKCNIEIFLRFPMRFDEYPSTTLQTIIRLMNKYWNVKINEDKMLHLNRGGLIPDGGLDEMLGPVEKSGVCPNTRMGCILYNGDFSLCYMNDMDRSKVIGNVLKIGLKRIFNGKKYKQAIHEQSQNIYKGICENCNERW